MKESIILKTIAEICILFTFVSLFLKINESLLIVFSFTILLLACGLISVKFNKLIFRILVSIIPLITFIFIDNFITYLFVGIAYLYYLLIIILNRNYLEYESYKTLFAFEIVAIIIFLLILFAGSYIGTYINEGILVFAILFFIFGISSLRLVRMQEYSDFKWRIANVSIIFVVSAISILFFYLIHLGIINSKVIFDTILLPISYFFTWFFGLFGKLFSHTSSNSNESTSEVEDSSSTNVEEIIGNEERKSSAIHEFMNKEFNIPWAKIFLALFVILLIVLMILLVKRLSRKAKPALKYETSNDSYKKAKRKKNKVIKDNAYQVRNIYKKYLYYLKSKGITIIEGNTSNEILVNSKKVTTSLYASMLRDIYIKARYDINAINETDVEKSKKYYDAIIKNLEDDNS